MRKDAAINQQKILATAQQLFATQGVAAVSMKAIAAAAGIGAGTLYRHYAHKSTLCLALVIDQLQAFVVDSQHYLATHHNETATMHFNRIVGRYLAIREANMALLASVEAGEPGRLQFYQSLLYQQLNTLFQQVIDELKPGLSPETVQFRADMLMAMLKSTSYAFQRQQRHQSPEAILTGLRTLLQGL